MEQNKSTRRDFLKAAGLSTAAVGLAGCFDTSDVVPSTNPLDTADYGQPNILWLSCEDMGPHLGCYGDENAHTPILDQFASEGVLFENAFTVAGVCAPNRSAIITGVYPTTLGTMHMRSGGEGVNRSIMPNIPAYIRCFSEYLRLAGYYCTNNSKEDYNFIPPEKSWDDSSTKAHWRNRPNTEQPFFSVFNYTGTHEGSIRLDDDDHAKRTERLTEDQKQAPEKLTLPPYYPDTTLVRKQWAKYYELITAMDFWVGDILRQLEDDGLAENTIVFFWSDHGVGMPRAKRWLYDSGTRIPLIVRIPEKYRIDNQGTPGTRSSRLVSSLDFAPTVMNIVREKIPEHMQGRPFIGPNLGAGRRYVFGFRDRMDERYDIIRSVRDGRYRYIRNYQPYKPYYQYIQSAEQGPVMKEIRRINAIDELPYEAQLFMKNTKPIEELYDLQNDPHEVKNLADDSQHTTVLRRFRAAHIRWMLDTNDLGLIPEPELVTGEKEHGTRYRMLRRFGDERHRRNLFYIAAIAGSPNITYLSKLTDALKDEDPSIRYWGAVGLRNLGYDAKPALDFITAATNDTSPVVRIAAARALCNFQMEERALEVLIAELKSPLEWVRLHAAIELDELGEKARPVIEEIRQALQDKHNKYVVRVANHALNILEETDNTVR